MKSFLFIFFFLLSNFILAQITFDADFESGNLSVVEEIDSVSFNIYSYEDIGGRWFYYRILGVENKKVNVKILNSSCNRPMYSYDNINFVRFTKEESPTTSYFEKFFEYDTVYVAFYNPYTFSFLQERINTWQKNKDVKIDTLGFTPKNLPMQEIIITDFSIPDSNKIPIWIHARTHPGETPSSWHFDGIVEQLLSNKEEIKYYKERMIFHLIPFVNPDGVYYGRSRVNFDGTDLERDWYVFSTQEVNILKSRMIEILDNKVFPVFLNLHSQSSSYCTFWIHYPGSTSAKFYDEEFKFAYLNVSDNPYFSPADFSQSNLQNYFPEGWLWINHGEDVMALTYETPYDYYHDNSDSAWVDNENLMAIGSRTIYSIAEYLQVSHPHHYLMDNTIATIGGNFNNYSVGNEYFGDDFVALDQGSDGTYAIFTSEDLPSGSYDVAAWWPTSEGNSYESTFEINAGSNYYEITKTQKVNGGQWNYLTSVELNEAGTISLTMNSNSTGLVVADAFRLIYSGPITSIEGNNIPTEFVLFQNYPNPFNPTTTIQYSIPYEETRHALSVQLKVYDVLGKEVTTLVDEHKPAGMYKVVFNSSGLASGTYFYRLQVGKNVLTKKMIFLK